MKQTLKATGNHIIYYWTKQKVEQFYMDLGITKIIFRRMGF